VDRDGALVAALWVTVALEVAGALLALALVRPGLRVPRWLPVLGGRRVPGWLLLAPAWGAGTLLAGHGSLFVSMGALAALHGSPLTSEVRWYALLWGPWFVLGGVLFMAAGWSYLRRAPDRRMGVAASALGALGGLAVADAPLVVSAIV
jgi:hypothetical protein